MPPGHDLLARELRDHIAAGSVPTTCRLGLWLSWLENPEPTIDELRRFTGPADWCITDGRAPAKYARRFTTKQFREIERQAIVARELEISP